MQSHHANWIKWSGPAMFQEYLFGYSRNAGWRFRLPAQLSAAGRLAAAAGPAPPTPDRPLPQPVEHALRRGPVLRKTGRKKAPAQKIQKAGVSIQRFL